MNPDRATAAQQIINAGKFLDARGLAPATSGNYSVRMNDGNIAVTVSGFHKGRLDELGVMAVDKEGNPLENKKPSAETFLHTQIYKLCPDANAILHVHSVPGAVLTRINLVDDVVLSGYEMLKIFPGIDTHNASVTIPVFENSQDMNILGKDVEKKISKDVPAYIIRDHGFYVWGRDMAEAEHLAEALEYLLSCEVETMKIRAGARA